MNRRVPLDPAAEKVCIENAKPPLIFQLPPAQGRKALDKAQDAPIYMCPAKITNFTADTGKWGKVRVYLTAPEHLAKPVNIIFYIHGAGWVFGNFHTHEKLVRELAVRTNTLLIFPEYSLSPEAKYPTAIEQCYSILCQIPDIADTYQFVYNPKTLTVAGDSVGGNMAIAMTFLAKERHGPKIHKQLLYYPVTNAFFDTASYREFACGYYLYRAGMQWFWNQYTSSVRERMYITASPLRAPVTFLKDLPAAMLIHGEADVLRDEGEAYGKKLRLAGVDVTAVRCQGTIHDFVMLHALDQTDACRAAMDASTDWINRKNRAADT